MLSILVCIEFTDHALQQSVIIIRKVNSQESNFFQELTPPDCLYAVGQVSALHYKFTSIFKGNFISVMFFLESVKTQKTMIVNFIKLGKYNLQSLQIFYIIFILRANIASIFWSKMATISTRNAYNACIQNLQHTSQGLYLSH